MSQKSPAKILIVDDHPIVREGLAGRLSKEPDLRICGEAADATDAIKLIENLHPDLVIVDISLKASHGIDLIKQLKVNSQIKVLVHTMYDEAVYADRALQAGAEGYITKQEAPELVVDAVRTVLRGDVYVSTEMQQRLVQRAIGRRKNKPAATVESLSDRELEVFRLIGEGLTTRAIAERLLRSTHTIETHRENIKRKLSLKNAAELSRAAVQWVLDNG